MNIPGESLSSGHLPTVPCCCSTLHRLTKQPILLFPDVVSLLGNSASGYSNPSLSQYTPPSREATPPVQVFSFSGYSQPHINHPPPPVISFLSTCRKPQPVHSGFSTSLLCKNQDRQHHQNEDRPLRFSACPAVQLTTHNSEHLHQDNRQAGSSPHLLPIMAPDEKKRPAALKLTPARSQSVESVSSTDSSSTSSSLAKPPRTPRFAEATTIVSPIEPPTNNPFSEKAQPGDVGFGYIGNSESRDAAVPMTPKSPLKSALRAPGSNGRAIPNPLSPTFKEEQILSEKEKRVEKDQKRDLVSAAVPCCSSVGMATN